MTEAPLICPLMASTVGVRNITTSSNDVANSSGKEKRTRPVYQIIIIRIPPITEYLRNAWQCIKGLTYTTLLISTTTHEGEERTPIFQTRKLQAQIS